VAGHTGVGKLVWLPPPGLPKRASLAQDNATILRAPLIAPPPPPLRLAQDAQPVNIALRAVAAPFSADPWTFDGPPRPRLTPDAIDFALPIVPPTQSQPFSADTWTFDRPPVIIPSQDWIDFALPIPPPAQLHPFVPEPWLFEGPIRRGAAETWWSQPLTLLAPVPRPFAAQPWLFEGSVARPIADSWWQQQLPLHAAAPAAPFSQHDWPGWQRSPPPADYYYTNVALLATAPLTFQARGAIISNAPPPKSAVQEPQPGSRALLQAGAVGIPFNQDDWPASNGRAPLRNEPVFPPNLPLLLSQFYPAQSLDLDVWHAPQITDNWQPQNRALLAQPAAAVPFNQDDWPSAAPSKRLAQEIIRGSRAIYQPGQAPFGQDDWPSSDGRAWPARWLSENWQPGNLTALLPAPPKPVYNPDFGIWVAPRIRENWQPPNLAIALFAPIAARHRIYIDVNTGVLYLSVSGHNTLIRLG
jgi:hypothetical protein